MGRLRRIHSARRHTAATDLRRQRKPNRFGERSLRERGDLSLHRLLVVSQFFPQQLFIPKMDRLLRFHERMYQSADTQRDRSS